MFKNYLKTAWRNLLKGKTYSVINITGMGMGIGICILIFLFVNDEWSFDKFHSKSDRIYRAWVKEHFKGDIFFNSITPYPLGSELNDNFPSIEQTVRYTTINSLVKKNGNVEEQDVHLVEPSFLDVFDFNILSGSSSTLEEKHHAILSTKSAKKYFGDDSPLGKNIVLQVAGEWTDFTVGAVMEDPPFNSSIQYEILIPFENTTSYMSEFGMQCWTCVSVETYVLLNQGQDVDEFEKTVAPFIDKKVARDYKPGEYIVGFQPLADIHLNNDIPQGIVAVSDSRYPYILSGVALLILLLACINFTTLAIGRSVSRSKEIGVRKVTGATRPQIMFQFWSEAFLTVFAGVLLGIILAKFSLPFFNQIADKNLLLSPNPSIVMGLGGIFIITGIVAGIYPALVLSGYKPIHALKGIAATGKKSKASILTWLVGFQFVLSVVLIICTGIMQTQMSYLQNKNLGFEKSQVITFPYNVSGEGLVKVWEDGNKIHARLKDRLASNSSILGTSISSHALGSVGWLSLGYTDKVQNKFRNFNAIQVDENFLPLMEIDIVDGRNFSKEFDTDEKGVIINQAMISEYNLENPIGKLLPEPFNDYKILGTTGDFHFSSLHNPVDPLVMSYDMLPLIRAAPDMGSMDPINPKFSVKVKGGNLQRTIRDIQNTWKEVAPDQSFTYSFIDNDIDMLYRKETKLSNIIGYATVLALFIACLGLFGISALKISHKTKEIGIRKVLGASSSSILSWLSMDYLKLIFISAMIASPLAWYAMTKWLQDFEFHVGISWWIFVMAAIVTASVALIAVSFQSVRASRANPVESLRTE